MTKEEFISFIKEVGFTQTWQSEGNSFSMATDVVGLPNSNYTAFADQLKITISDELDLAQLSLSQMSSHIMAGKNFGNFNLKTFGEDNDFQMEIFMSFIKGSFKKVPDSIIQFMRDRKISDILK